MDEGAAIFGGCGLNGLSDAKACRNCSGNGCSAGGSAAITSGSLSFLPSRFASGPLAATGGISERTIGTLSRPRMLAAAAPTTRKHASARMVIVLVKQISVSAGEPQSTFLTNGH